MTHLFNLCLNILVEICAVRRAGTNHSSSSIAYTMECTGLGMTMVVVALPAPGDHLDALEDVDARSGHRLHFCRVIGQETDAPCYKRP